MRDKGLSILSDITVFSKYAKYIPEAQTRETWAQIVTRYKDMLIKKYPALREEIEDKIKFVLEKKVLPSMRALQFAGPAMEINNARGYNCAYLPVDSIYSFSETMFLLLGGSGVGFSVQKRHISKLPAINKSEKIRSYLIEDSIMGWADAIKVLMKAYFGLGPMPIFDFRAIRAKGARLVTAGGKAPGPEPLKRCIEQIREVLDRKVQGEVITDIECYDILCFIADSVLAGGIRRSAMICLFDMDSMNMLICKSNFIVLNWMHQYRDGIEVVHVDEATGKKYYDIEVRYTEPFYGISTKKIYWISEEDIKNLEENSTLP
jgi:ribonucleoside-diphosphate reductase alpha chain